VAVDVIYSDEPVPPGFERVARDMCKGSSRSAYLCFRRQREPARREQDEEEAGKEEAEAEGEDEEAGERLQPLAEAVLAAADEDPGEGFVRLEKPLGRGASPLFLCFKRVSPAGPSDAQPWSPAALKVRACVREL
jgi:hypothetical protein